MSFFSEHNLVQEARNGFRVIFGDEDLGYLDSDKHNTLVLYWGGLFLAVISAVLTVFNLVMGYWAMMGTTAFLALGFSVACVLARNKAFKASRIVMALICAVNFSMYALTGSNDGFAILWIVLIPIIGMLLLGLRTGFVLSLYFQVFLIVLFYTPLCGFVAQHYTSTFMARFPVLYFTSFGAITFLMYQRQKLYIETSKQAVRDGLTGLLNRRRLMEVADELGKEGVEGDLSVATIDINRLKWVNDNLGHLAGDEIIKAAAVIICESFPDASQYRIGGDEFVVVSRRASLDEQVHTLREKEAAWKGVFVDSISLAVGTASRADHPGASYEELSRCADQLMYQDKGDFYYKTGLDRRH